MFKVNNINGDQIETTSRPANVIGRGVHLALQSYFGGGKEAMPKNDGEAIKLSHEVGVEFLKSYSDGFIEYTEAIPNKAKIDEKYAFAFFGYLKEFDWQKEIKEVLLVERMLTHKVQVGEKVLPVPLKGAADLVYRDMQGRIIMRDHKFTSKYSDAEAIDGAKLIQAAFNYFLVYAELGEAPYSMVYEEYKIVENRDKSRQMREFEIVFDQHPLIFDFFFRFYEDVTNALMGKQVYVPNLFAIYDREVSILAYIHRLDIDTEREAAFKKLNVDNITDFLKKKIQKDGAMKKYLEVVSQKFISASTLNYKDMTTEERIKMKLAEHGLGVEFHSKVSGGSVTLYRYEPSIGLKMSKIEAYVKDIEQVVEVSGIRILAPIPDSGLIGFEVPQKARAFPKGLPTPDGFNVAIGVNIMGETERLDIRETPHMLVAGSTGSGKSVFINSLITQLQSLPSTKAQIVLLDPKMVELGQFEAGANTKAYQSEIMGIHEELKGLVGEMNARYKTMQAKGFKKLEDYRAKGGKIPYVFVFIDEYGDLIATKHVDVQSKVVGVYQSGQRAGEDKVETIKTDISGEIRNNILLLSQKARAAGIHLILTTQRPSVNIVDGAIKANFPTRVAFRTSTAVDSLVIIDQAGAEKLLGKGDMLLLSPAKNGLDRLQGFSV